MGVCFMYQNSNKLKPLIWLLISSLKQTVDESISLYDVWLKTFWTSGCSRIYNRNASDISFRVSSRSGVFFFKLKGGTFLFAHCFHRGIRCSFGGNSGFSLVLFVAKSELILLFASSLLIFYMQLEMIDFISHWKKSPHAVKLFWR